MKGSHKFISELGYAIDTFRPVLKYLQIKKGVDGFACLSYFPNLRKIDSIKEWEIVLLITDLKHNLKSNDNPIAHLLFKAKKNNKNFIRCYIVMDKIYFIKNENLKVNKETRITIFVHEFMHFLSYIYARINNRKFFFEILYKRLSEKIDNLNNKQILELQQFLDKLKPIDDFTNSKYTDDNHFRLGKEDTLLNYSDLYRNFLLSRQLFDEYFNKHDKDKFSSLWQKEEYGEAIGLYKNIAKQIAQEEWLTENFAINQAFSILKEYYVYELL
ncbi:MAG: hypothetical protein LBC80_06735 [Treponema sp.]|jgi:hypothetical protein|nr:hypothetical protein [Treponema sp.]